MKLASRLEVSTKTIERDMEELEKAGVVRTMVKRIPYVTDDDVRYIVDCIKEALA